MKLGMMLECPPSTIPLLERMVLLSDMSSLDVDTTYYSHIFGKLVYLMNMQPDINYSIGIVSWYMVSPQQSHLDAVLHILRYLQHTTDYGLLYRKKFTPHFVGFTHVVGPS